MKKILLLWVFIGITFNCFSQDYLLMRDGTEKKVVVFEVTSDVVKYRRYGTDSKAIYRVDKASVRKIIYEDGEEDVFATNIKQQRANRIDYSSSNSDYRVNVKSNRISNDVNIDNWDYSELNILIGIKTGFNISTISGVSEMFRLSGMRYSIDPIFGFHIGIAAQFNLSREWFFQPELLYSSQGCEIEGESGILGYLKMPMYMGYKVRTGSNLSVILGLGGYLAYGVYGEDDAFEEAFRRFDIGLSGFAGVQMKNTQITIGYDYGMRDIIGIDAWHAAKILDSNIPNICNRTLKMSVTQFFW